MQIGADKIKRMSGIFWCKNCLNTSTRPRITFDERGWCNACQWAEEKRSLDWSLRQSELEQILDSHRSSDGSFDCIVPVSGGKDGSYVSHQLKHKYGMNPLAITVTPSLPLTIGNQNLKNFIASGYNLVQVSCAENEQQKLNKQGFILKGFPYYGWLIAIETVPLIFATKFSIPLIFYGEEGEVEYGGSSAQKNKTFIDLKFIDDVYLEGGHDLVLNESKLSSGALMCFNFPKGANTELKITHWSYFENWDPYRNYLVAKQHCGLIEAPDTNSGTFTNFAQNDQGLYSLHAYIMYLKFGFGRATQDAGIEIRRGAMTREQAINLVKHYDGIYPEESIDSYLDYYKMTLAEFEAVIDKWTNTDLFKKQDGRWKPTFTIK